VVISLLINFQAGNLPIERHDSAALPSGWDGDDPSIARRFGNQWLAELRSAVLVGPSVVAKLEWNAVVNPLHPAARQLVVSQSQKVIWDQRLFGRKDL
jgi:RES domain-containing protein